MGMCHHILFGNIEYKDEKNGMTGYMNIGDIKGRPRDYFTGHIEHNGKKACKRIEGTYMGYADFDGERYFDVRQMNILEQ